MTIFTREERYTVLKNNDVQSLHEDDQNLLAAIAKKIALHRQANGKAPMECVVVERDWPEFEPTWKAIEARVSEVQQAQEPDLSGLKPKTQERIREWLTDGTFVSRAIGAMLEQERKLMAYEAEPAPKQADPSWQLIESAPKDGTTIDLWHGEFGRFPDCYWGLPQHTCGEAGSLCDDDIHSVDEGWVTTFNDIPFPASDYTHWVPLPTPPEAK